jgi:hypothetical protein
VDVQQITDVDAILLSGSFFFSPAAEMDLSAETTTDADAVAAETTAAGWFFFCYSVAATETDAAESSNICVRNVCSKVHNQKGMQYLHPFLHIKCYPSFVAFSFWIWRSTASFTLHSVGTFRRFRHSSSTS